MKIYNSEKVGTTYWLDDDVLMFAPTPKDGIINFKEDGGEVDFDLMLGEMVDDTLSFNALYLHIINQLNQ